MKDFEINLIFYEDEVLTVHKMLIRGRKKFISHGAFRLHCLLRCLKYEEEKRDWNITVSGLATELRTNRSTVNRYLSELEDNGLIKKEVHETKPYSYNFHVYPFFKDEYRERLINITKST